MIFHSKKAPVSTVLILCCLAFLLLCMLFGALSIILKIISAAFYGNPLPPISIWLALKAGFGSPLCLKLSFLCLFLVSAVFFFRRLRLSRPNPVSFQDERGVSFLKKGIYGSSRWMTKKEASKRFLVGNIKDVRNTVYGRFHERSNKVVAYSENARGGNRHVMLIGSSGSGKSVSFVRTEIIQSILRGESVVVTDPSAELFTDLASFAQTSGANVKVLNLSSPLNGNGWNCIEECISPDTLSLDSGRLNDFANIYMRNAAYIDTSDSFWAAAELNLFKAAIGLCAYRRNKVLNQFYQKLLAQILRQGGYGSSQIQSITSSIVPESSIRDTLNVINAYAAETNFDRDLIDATIDAASAAAPPFTISEVYNTVLSLDDEEQFREEFLRIPMTHPAAVAYKTYSSKELTEKIKASVRIGLLNKLQLFNDPALKAALSIEDLHFSDIGEKQSVLFLITPDKSDTLKPIASLAFSFLFKDLSDEWDKEQSNNRKKETPNMRIPVSVIMDEFYSVGTIPSFPVFIATCRKRLINITICLQNIGQAIKECQN